MRIRICTDFCATRSRRILWSVMQPPAHLDCALPDPQAAALIADESGTIVFASDPVQRLLGHDPRALCGQSVEVL